jgi:hypothetical protein
MAAKKLLSVHEALGGWRRPRRPHPKEDPRAAQAAREDFCALGWAVEYTQRQQSLLWLGHGLEGFGGGCAGSELQPWHYYEGWDDW